MGLIVILVAWTANVWAINQTQFTTCQAELSQKGYPPVKQIEFCRSLPEAQWACSQLILKKYHSLEMVRDVCSSARPTESACLAQVMNRNYDPYVAKQVCRLR
jgi:hypothetical protein